MALPWVRTRSHRVAKCTKTGTRPGLLGDAFPTSPHPNRSEARVTRSADRPCLPARHVHLLLVQAGGTSTRGLGSCCSSARTQHSHPAPRWDQMDRLGSRKHSDPTSNTEAMHRLFPQYQSQERWEDAVQSARCLGDERQSETQGFARLSQV